jgi:hypothetical protein
MSLNYFIQPPTSEADAGSDENNELEDDDEFAPSIKMSARLLKNINNRLSTPRNPNLPRESIRKLNFSPIKNSVEDEEDISNNSGSLKKFFPILTITELSRYRSNQKFEPIKLENLK